MTETGKKKIGILQPVYLPWIGYFEQMALTDLFVHYDTVQHTRRDWRNRNRIVMGGAEQLLTVPTRKTALDTPITEVEISYEQTWQKKHLKQLRLAYGSTPYFQPLFDEIAAVIERAPQYLWDLDTRLVAVMARHFGIDTPTAFASEVPDQSADKNQRIIDVCKHFGADILYDGKSAQDFIDMDLFAENGIEVIFQDYQHPVYPQGKGDFLSHMSALDLLFRHGPEARDIMLSSPRPATMDLAA